MSDNIACWNRAMLSSGGTDSCRQDTSSSLCAALQTLHGQMCTASTKESLSEYRSILNEMT